MLSHPTVTSETVIDEVTAIVLVGPPASGKTTIRRILGDYDVTRCDLAPYAENGEIVDDGWKELVDVTLGDAAEGRPKLACIEGALTDGQIEYVRDRTSGHLVIRIDVSDRTARLDRYVDRELSKRESDRSVLTNDVLASVQGAAVRRQFLEEPYPDHHVTITNDEAVQTSELTRRCADLVCALSELTHDDVESPGGEA